MNKYFKFLIYCFCFCFIIFAASPAALSVLCTHFNSKEDPQDNTPNVLKVVVADDWEQASVIPQDKNVLDIVLHLTCNGRKSMNEDFKCGLYLDFDIGYSSFNFLRDSKNKMTFVVESKIYSEENRTTYECVTASMVVSVL